jgi:hypothetical protein
VNVKRDLFLCGKNITSQMSGNKVVRRIFGHKIHEVSEQEPTWGSEMEGVTMGCT